MTQGRGFPDDEAGDRTEVGFFGSPSERPTRGALDTERESSPRQSPIDMTRTTEAASGMPASTVAGIGGAGKLRGPIVPGRIIANLYCLLEPIGKGGMGEVWLVRRLDLECPRALKLIDQRYASDPEIRARFLREAQVMARLNHPNAVTVHHMGLTDDDAFIEMEYIEGRTLDRVLTRGEPQPLDWTARILAQLCDVLHLAHEKKIVHRDLKPTNLMLLDGRPPGCEHLKVLDFGIAKILDPEKTDPDSDLTRPGSFIGTILYTSPEQATHGPVDGRTDLYTVGVILYELLTGHRPFTGQAALHGHVFLPPPPLASANPAARVPAEVEAVVLRCLAKNPADRPGSAAELAREFLGAVKASSCAGTHQRPEPSREELHPAGASGNSGYQDLTTQAVGRDVASETTRADLPERDPPGYEMLQRIGESDSATVYRARDDARQRFVAIKELHPGSRSAPDLQPGGRFWEEARSQAGLEHAHLVPILDVDESRGWIVMDLMRGGLDARLDEGPIRPESVRGIVRQALEALRFLHDRGKVHGAIKPANLLIDDRGRVRLGDPAGIGPVGPIDTPRGTPKYVAPERLNPRFGPVGPGVDLYGLGFTALELLLGPAFDRLFPEVADHPDDPATAWLRWQSEPAEHLPPCREVVPNIPEDLARVVDRLVRKDVAARYPDAASALKDLEDRPILEIDLSPTSPTRPGPPPPGQDEPPNVPDEPGGEASGARPPMRGRLSHLLRNPRILVPMLLLVIAPLAFLAWSLPDRATTIPVKEPIAKADTPAIGDTGTSNHDEPARGQEGTTEPRNEGSSRSGTTGSPGSINPGPSPSPTPEPTAGSSPRVSEERPPIEVTTLRPVEELATLSARPPQGPAVELPPPSDLTLPSVKMTVVLIPAGTFAMGSPDGVGDPNEQPQHEVTISRPFYLGQTEVTQAQYERVMGENPSYFSETGGGRKHVLGVPTDRFPVETVSHGDAQEFCLRLAHRENLPEGSIRLPTEAEWEYASRANKDQSLLMGEALLPLAWFQLNAKGQTHPVAQKQPNDFHLYDMAGNVAEWCRDWYAPYPDVPLRDPEGPLNPAGSAFRVLRGGSWLGSDRSCRPTDRSGAEPDQHFHYFGFRIVLDVDAARRLLTLDH